MRLLFWGLPMVVVTMVLTVVAAATVPNWELLGNWGTVWAIPAFAVGSRAHRQGQGAVAGAVVIVAIYGGLLWSTGGPPFAPWRSGIWVITALVGGAAAGLLGYWWAVPEHWSCVKSTDT